MRIAVPVAQGVLNLHFGHCKAFVLLDVDQDKKEILQRDEVDAPKHEPGVLPQFLADRGVNVIISGGMGSRAQDLFESHGISVICGAPIKTPEELVKEYLAGTLVAGDNAC
ncbi:MAG: NifB/NifX family molybdenum-iron cluster-binding protein, partial [Sphaerochaetaceae bacterium]